MSNELLAYIALICGFLWVVGTVWAWSDEKKAAKRVLEEHMRLVAIPLSKPIVRPAEVRVKEYVPFQNIGKRG